MKKYNFEINLEQKQVMIKVASSIFPVQTILRAAYHFIEETDVIVDQQKDKVLVIFIKETEQPTKESLQELAYEFNVQLISSFLEEAESNKHVSLREELVKAALSPKEIQTWYTGPSSGKGPRPNSFPKEKQTKTEEVK